MKKNWVSAAPATGSDSTPEQRLMWACFRNDVPAVRSLVAAHGSGLLLRAPDGDSKPIHAAASEGALEIVQMILDAGEDVSAPSTSGTPLHFAAGASQLAVVKLLVESGADLNAVNVRATPIMAAVSRAWCDPKVVLYLLEKGADTSAKHRDFDGHDFIRIVLRHDNARVFVALTKAGLLEKGPSEPAVEFALGKAQMAQVHIPAITKACLDDPELSGSLDAEYLRELTRYENSSVVRALLLSKATEVALLGAVKGSAEDAPVRGDIGGGVARKGIGGMSL